MKKINSNELAEETWSSPKGKFAGAGKEISEALGRKPRSTDLMERHPFDVEIIRIAPARGRIHIICTASSGVLSCHRRTAVCATRKERRPSGLGCFLFKPNEPHQLINDGVEDLVVYVVADNPMGESVYFPDSQKWGVRSPERRCFVVKHSTTMTARNSPGAMALCLG